jgi:hypothetical protein
MIRFLHAKAVIIRLHVPVDCQNCRFKFVVPGDVIVHFNDKILPGSPALDLERTNALRNYSLYTNFCTSDMECGLTDRI